MTRARDLANLIGSGNYTTETLTATAGQTVFTPSNSYTPNFIQIYMNGLLLDDTVDYTATNGTTITLTVAASAGDEMEVVTYNTFSVGDAITQTEADGRYVNVTGDTITGDLSVGSNALFVDSTNNRVGIGTSSPSAGAVGGKVVHVQNSGATASVRVDRSDATTAGTLSMTSGSTTNGLYGTGAKPIAFSTDSTERMRIDASGNLLVGKTSANTATVGVEALSDGTINGTVTGNRVLSLDRLGSDGEIIRLRRSSTTVGSIGVASSAPYLVRNGVSGVAIASGGQFIATNTSGIGSDNTRDLGASTIRWDDVYATNGTIQTSDANEKQQIAELTAAEMQAAKAISKLFKTFKWNDSVAEKGDAARIHTGVIAQEVEAAMTAAGLDAGRYAFFISSTWWESTEVIPAVEEVLDEEGNVVTEAQPERTVTHTHDTAEEAPAGAVERTRKGIRYPQLLAFIGAATEQRLASIEARLDALETV